jgi:hypothetical protein
VSFYGFRMSMLVAGFCAVAAGKDRKRHPTSFFMRQDARA